MCPQEQGGGMGLGVKDVEILLKELASEKPTERKVHSPPL